MEFENSKRNKIQEIYIMAKDKGWENQVDINIRTYSVYVQMFVENVSVSMTTNNIDKKHYRDVKRNISRQLYSVWAMALENTQRIKMDERISFGELLLRE